MVVQAYKLGALGQDSVAGIKSAVAFVNGATPHYMTFESPVGTDYQVTAGKTFYITKMDMRGRGASDNLNLVIGYGDNGVASGTSAPTNWVELTGVYYVSSSIFVTTEYDVIVVIPAQKYPCAKNLVGTADVTIYGIEV